MSEIKLRPHHILCISFFEGKGYSPEFVCNMKSVMQSLNRNGQVLLIDGGDDICICCPKYGSGRCVCENKVNQYDEAVRSVCKLETNQTLSWQELISLAASRIIEPGLRKEICGDCQWSGICIGKAQTDESYFNK